MKRAFTIIETVIVIAIIAIISAVLIPVMANAYNGSKKEIIDIYNGGQIQIIDVDTNEIIYEGKRENANIDNYTLVDVEYNDGVVVMYVKI